MNDLGEEPLVDWKVGFGMRKSELRTPWRRPGCCGGVAPMIGDGSLWVILEIRRFIGFGDFLFEELKIFGCIVWNWMFIKEYMRAIGI